MSTSERSKHRDRFRASAVSTCPTAWLMLLIGLAASSADGGDWSLAIGAKNGVSLRPLLGVNAGPSPAEDPDNADLTVQYQQIGVNLVRTHDFYGPLDMAEMYPDHTADPSLPSSFDFTESDARFRAILDAGLVPYFRLGDSYHNPSPPDPIYVANYAEAAVNVVRHYREGLWGGFSKGFPCVEIWNEPGEHFWPGQTQAQFNDFYLTVSRELRAAMPDLKIGGPGWAPRGALTAEGRADVASFLSAVAAAGAPLDFLSWHMYSNRPQDYAYAASYYRGALDSNGLGQAESHVTEWNTSTAAGDLEATRIGARGAAINTGAWIALQNSDVTVSTFYRGNDTLPEYPTFYGMFFADGTPKKTALAFSLWSDAAAHPEQRNLHVTEGALGDLWALSGEDDQGNIVVLISNLDANATSYGISFDDGTGLDLSQFEASLKVVSDGVEGVGTFPVDPGNATIGGHTVHLLTLTVPEPATAALLAVGLTGLLCRGLLRGERRRS